MSIFNFETTRCEMRKQEFRRKDHNISIQMRYIITKKQKKKNISTEL